MRRSAAFLLAFGIIVLLAVNSADFLFRQPYYESWDSAANSLSILRAKHFAQLYGPYSRYEFYHPGPAFFYVQALGEWLFHDVLHLVPTPFQGQLLINLCLMTGFFVAALSVFVHWLPVGRRWLFLCVALVLGTLHFGMMGNLPSLYDLLGGSSAFLSVWPIHTLPLPFLCLLTAGASVAAGRGRDLPLLVLAGGFLVAHVAQPLFVGSTAVVAYGGLVVGGAARQRTGAGGRSGQEKSGWRTWWLAAWREDPRAHLLAGGLLGLFLLPMVIDLWWGKESNFASILRHLHEAAGDRKSLTRSFTYFLQYGAYAPYQAGADHFGHYDRSGFLAYLRAHELLYAGWLLVLILVLQAPFAYLWTLAQRRAKPPVPAAVVEPRRFLAWGTLLALLNVALSLYWGTRQDLLMYYYNSWFNFAIYYFCALVAVAVLCTTRLTQATIVDGGAEAGTIGGRLLLARMPGVGAVTLTAVLFAGRLRIHDLYDPAAARSMHQVVERAIAAEDASHPSTCKVLFVPDDYWTTAVAIGLQLARAGDPFVVLGRWKNTFGAQHDWERLNPSALKNGLCPWYVVLPGKSQRGVPADAVAYPLRFGGKLILTPPVLELSARGSTAEINFAGSGNAADFILAGWSTSNDPAGNWSEEKWAALAFQPQTVVGTGVEISMDGQPLLVPAHGITRQRLRLYFNGTPLFPEQELSAFGTMHFSVPAAAWNAAAANPAPLASLAFEFPDAVVPATLDLNPPNSDPRRLAVFFQRVRLRVVP